MKLSRTTTRLWPTATPSGAWRVESRGLSLVVAERGAHLSEVSIPIDDGRQTISRDYPADGTTPAGYHGASIGRYANRIAGARFDLDGVAYRLTANEGENQLHGGSQGFSAADWHGEAEVVGGVARVELHHRSPDGDQGFPGNVYVGAVFDIAEDRLLITYSASTDAATPLNLTNHTYWNLGADGSDLAGHRLAVAADRFVEVDNAAGIPVAGPPTPVLGTRFDCRQAQSLIDIVDGGGLDHCFVPRPAAGDEPLIVLAHESGRSIELTTDQPGIQIYTGTHLSPPSTAIAFEPQHPPDTPNRPDLGDCTLRPGDDFLATTEIRFSW